MVDDDSCMNNEGFMIHSCFMIQKSSSSLIIIHNSLIIYDSWIMSDDDSFMNNNWSMSDYYAHTWMNHDWLWWLLLNKLWVHQEWWVDCEWLR